MKNARRAADVEALLREIQRYLAIVTDPRSLGRKRGRAGRTNEKEGR